jgi:hypothetical protein
MTEAVGVHRAAFRRSREAPTPAMSRPAISICIVSGRSYVPTPRRLASPVIEDAGDGFVARRRYWRRR